MEQKDIFARLPDALLPWYHAHKRQLPWREDRDPYHIWVSEIMLQQTRVEAVKGYYTRFLETFPTVFDLAGADDELLHKMWEGLGYYSRVRNLKKAAQVIVNDYCGVFPREYDTVLSLPGIGAYTAGAICSIAYDQGTPAVDGNVLRVVSRLLNDPTPVDDPAFKRLVQKKLVGIYPVQAGDFTQALMELGATVCGPNRKPDCEGCPCKGFCGGYKSGNAASLPTRKAKKERRVEKKTVLILYCDGCYALEKRPKSGLLAGLWQFPNMDGFFSVEETLHLVEELGIKPKEIKMEVERKHIFTHIEWKMCGIYLEVLEKGGTFTWQSAEQIRKQAALPTAFRQFFDEIDNT